MERFGPDLTLPELCAEDQVDLVVTGAAAVTREGVHFGKGHGYFDIEWGLLAEIGLVGAQHPGGCLGARLPGGGPSRSRTRSSTPPWT